MQSDRILIVGGGLAGLSLAPRQHGLQPEVVERGNREASLGADLLSRQSPGKRQPPHCHRQGKSI